MKSKKMIILIIIISIIAVYVPISFGTPIAQGPLVELTDKGVVLLLSSMQVLQYVLPILFFIIKIIINKIKQNNKNTFKNICVYLLISFMIGLSIYALGDIILKIAPYYGSAFSIPYINYNGKAIYYR